MLVNGGYIMIRGSKHPLRTKHPDTSFVEACECLWTGNLVDKVPVNIQYIRTIGYRVHHMLFPDFIKKRFGHVINKRFKDLNIPNYKDMVKMV
jgi:hypothetical protein